MTDQYIITEKQFRPMIIELFRRIGEQLELKEEWNKLYNAERTAMAGDFYNIIIKNSNPYNPQAERGKVLDEAIKHWGNVIEYGKGVSYNHPVTYEWMYRGVVDYLKKLRQQGKQEE